MPDLDETAQPAEASPTATVAVAPKAVEPPSTDTDVEETKEELPPPSTVHVAAAAGTTAETIAAELPEGEEAEKFFIGMWGPHKNYGCPYCYFASLDGTGAVEMHIIEKVNGGDEKHRPYYDEPEGA